MSPPAGYAEGADFHRGCNHQWCLRRVTDCKLVMHETTINNGVILRDYLVAVAALQALLVTVALMGAILHLLEVPYHTKLANCCNQMALLLPILRDLSNFVTSVKSFHTQKHSQSNTDSVPIAHTHI